MNQQLQNLLNQQPNDTFFEHLAMLFGIPTLHKDVMTYIETHFDTKLIDGPFAIQGAKAALEGVYTYKQLFRFWENDESAQDLIPMIYLGHNQEDEHFFVIAESGQIVSLHIDSLVEDAFSYAENASYEKTQFLSDFAKDYCCINLSDLLAVQKQLIDCDDFDDILDTHSREEIKQLMAQCLDWSTEQVEESITHPGMSWAYYLIEED